LISEINCEIVRQKKFPKVKHLHSIEAEKIKAMVHTQDHNFFEKLITTGMKLGLILSVVDSFMYGKLSYIRAKFIPT